MFGLHEVEELTICVTIPDPVVLSAAPCIDPIVTEIMRWVAFHLRKHYLRIMGMVVDKVVTFYSGDEREEVLLELKADELF
jgi:hypothetical protein